MPRIKAPLAAYGRQFLRMLRLGDEGRYFRMETMGRLIYPRYCMSDYGAIHLDDAEFRQWYEQYPGVTNYRSYDRKYMLRELCKMLPMIGGHTAECGVYKGASSHIMASQARDGGVLHHAFDSFEGLSRPEGRDGGHWSPSDLAVSLEEVEENLSEFDNIVYHKGWIPHCFGGIESEEFGIVHLDVDLYQPTLDSARFFWPRLRSGGFLVCDDYGVRWCPGAKDALDEFSREVGVPVLLLPTGQGLMVKKP